ncbi:translation initiation factor IF-2 [Dokdonella sp.]|uniref:translation initiation factor IF-2 n=1 Tax=Dokdonella sp. TaxID=2291710 RepID=UPI0031BF2AE4|nr:translation initiation factor IF-2 [Dokdonella sp.]
MSEVTIKKLAKILSTTVDRLLGQLGEAGMEFSDPDQVISSAEKMKLLDFLQGAHGKRAPAAGEPASPRQITLSRRTVSEITVNPGQRGATPKTVSVEVRAKRTYVKRSVIEQEALADPEREEAKRKLDEAKQRREAEEQQRIESEQRRQAEEAAERAAEEARRAALEEEARQRQEAEAAELTSEPAAAEVPVPIAAPELPAPVREPARQRPDRAAPPPAGTEAPRHKTKHGSHRMREEGEGGSRYFGTELHLSQEGAARRTGRKRAKPRQAEQARSGSAHAFSRPTAPVVREIAVGETITVADLAQKLAIKGADVVKALFKMGVMVTINQTVDHDTAVLVAEELGHKVVEATDTSAESALLAQQPEGEQSTRPPVVTIMGHVDHGKTSLLDYIRRTKVASGEAGGITQHIGAYHVDTPKGVITFLDTPGHAAFSSMRARGAQSTDIVVLVVAADDGVKPQTVEAIQHARAANVPLIVAMNKMDKSEADPDRVKQGLVQHEVVPEEWGGDVQFVPVSAKTGDGVDNLLDAISVQAEVMDLQAVGEGRASGAVIESSLDKGRGPVATVLVQQGQLKRGDFLVCGVEYGRVRALFDEAGRQVESAGPSIPVQLLGLSGVPEAGDDFVVVEDERLAKEVAAQRQQKRRETRLVKQAGNRMEDIMAQMGQSEEQLILNLVVKADVQGSAEALREALDAISTDAIRVNVIASGVGGITESDATLAAASKAVIIGFNVRADASARKVIETNGLDLRYFSIIYDVIDQVKQVATGLLGVEIREEIIGTAEVREVFRSSKFGAVAGCMVVEGTVKRHKPIRVLRDNTVIFQGELESLRRFKENVDEVRNGMECGIGVKQYNDIKVGDQIECFERIEVARTL